MTKFYFAESQSFLRYSFNYRYMEIQCLQHKTEMTMMRMHINESKKFHCFFINNYAVYDF